MKRLFIVFILISLSCHFSVAAEDHNNFTLNAGLSVFFEADASPSTQAAEAFLLSSLAIGAGYHFNIIPHILAPGIYGDIHFSFITLLQDDKDIDDKDRFLFFQFGGRIYNQFRFGPLDIQPFAGLNLMVGDKDALGLKVFGILLAYKMLGFEYGYQLPVKAHMRSRERAIHRFALLFHVR